MRRFQTGGVFLEDGQEDTEEHGRDIETREGLEEGDRLDEVGGQSGRDVGGQTENITDAGGGPSDSQRRLRRQTTVDYRVFF